MGQEQRARMKAKIVSAAIGVFVEKGPYTPVVEDFATAAQVSRGTFYYYFPTVEALRAIAVEVVLNKFVADHEIAVRRISNPVVRFATAVRLFQRRARLDPQFAAFATSTVHIASEINVRMRHDIDLAMKEKLISMTGRDECVLVAHALALYGARFSTIGAPQVREKAICRTILDSWGVSKELIEEALAHRLPRALNPGGKKKRTLARRSTSVVSRARKP